MTFAKKMKKIRSIYGMTQEQFSELIQVGRKTYMHWEISRAVPRLETLLHVAKKLDTTVSDILEDVDG